MHLCAQSLIMSNSLQPHSLQPTRFFSPRDPPGKNPGLGCHALRQGIFPTQRSNPHLVSSALAAAAAKLPQSCPTLCDPRDGSPPDSPVPGILQARTLEWGAIAFSSAWKWKVKGKSLSRVRLFTIPRTAAYQAPPSMGFSRQEYWEWGAIAFSTCIGRQVLYHWHHLGSPRHVHKPP